jgi:hypothetical protein
MRAQAAGTRGGRVASQGSNTEPCNKRGPLGTISPCLCCYETTALAAHNGTDQVMLKLEAPEGTEPRITHVATTEAGLSGA